MAVCVCIVTDWKGWFVNLFLHLQRLFDCFEGRFEGVRREGMCDFCVIINYSGF